MTFTEIEEFRQTMLKQMPTSIQARQLDTICRMARSALPEAGGMAMAMQDAPTIGDHVVSALRDLAAMYSHAWDREDGALIMMGSSVQYFERCHAKAQRALEMVDKSRPQESER